MASGAASPGSGPVRTLRDWLDRLGATERLSVIKPGVDLVHEVAAIANRLARRAEIMDFTSPEAA